MEQNELLRVENLKTYYELNKSWFRRRPQFVKAVDSVSFTVRQGETLGLVGESGCGKSTLGRSILRLEKPTAGEIWYRGKNLLACTEKEMRALRGEMQMIFQDPYSSLNPKMTVGEIIGEPMLVHRLCGGRQRQRRVGELLELVGLRAAHARRYPHEFSGGQRQRVGIARALAVDPKLIICDEAVSALDVSIQAQVLNLLKRLQAEMRLTYIFISHGLATVKHMSTRVGVMYLGKMMELAGRESIYRKPLHPYTRALLSAIPSPDPEQRRERQILMGDVPSPANPPAGCRFHTRCPQCAGLCRTDEPELRQAEEGHWVACHLQ
jgi:oligopeptide/dipeptide ABC transporter ATP-binding protein